MNRLLITTAALSAIAFASAVPARDNGTINQRGPYEATMQFYLHPALGYQQGSARIDNHPGVLAHEAAARQPAATASVGSHPALAARQPVTRIAGTE